MHHSSGSRYRQRSAEERIRRNVTNPAYVTEISQSDYRVSPAEALTKMKMLEHCNAAVLNPVFLPQTDLPVDDPKLNDFISADKVVINPFFGMGVPDYSKLRATYSEAQRTTIHAPPENWVDQFPLHSAAYEGDAETIKQLVTVGYHADQPDMHSWVPLHYACWNGHADAVRALLQNGRCSPNAENENGSTPLHFASFRGHAAVVQLLVTHPDIDKTVVDKEDRTPLNLCEESRQNEWEMVAALLKEATQKPPVRIDVHLMDLDGSHVMLELPAGSNTTVSQLLKQLELPRGCQHAFAIWIASQSLHLQMRPEHKPVLHVKQWSMIIRQLTNYNPETEQPLLYLRRDALLTVDDERTIKDAHAVKTLFDECLVNVLKGMYPCSDADAVTLAGLYMQIVYGDHDPRKHKPSFLTNINLRHFIPAIKLDTKSQGGRSVNWAQKIITEHRNVTQKGVKDVTKLQLLYLEHCRGFSVYGSAYFFGSAQLGPSPGRQSGSNQAPPVFVGVNCRGIHLIHAISKSMKLSESYRPGLTWQCSADMQTLKLHMQDHGGTIRTVPIRSKQAAIIGNLANKISGRQPVPSTQSSVPMGRTASS
ncbi:krev interaction trapped protein 1-like [Patiria miniata]|uniref:FERM domain-containing protein n=1 Tax=Patiria miniata TaxID=46514 RepID=A0A914BBB4_PATMI|nr:krev interaction trapped protein 1-like [Patiria miniata]